MKEEEGRYEDSWSQGGESQALSDEEADYEAPPWPGDDYSESEFGDEPDGEEFEPEPPDYSQDDTSRLPRSEEGETGEEEDEGEDRERDFQSYYICFSGHSQGPEAYPRWEKDMEEWFSSNQVPEEEKTSYAEDTLTEDAFKHWDRDAYQRLEYDEPAATWEEMKQIMNDEFVRDVDNMRQYYSRIYTNPEPRRLILATRTNPKAKLKKVDCPRPEKVPHHVPRKNTDIHQIPLEVPQKVVRELPQAVVQERHQTGVQELSQEEVQVSTPTPTP